ncbi:hypothetical protein BH10PSE6_BH10PSE6_30580 [soil metagenome]
MAKCTVPGFSLLRAALLGATALAIVAGPAAAKVGVTSATDGDPLGKPPTDKERVLRIGIDVQANEVVTTNATDRAHLVFLDGTSVTIGPNARLVIDRFVYDPNTKKGELALTAGTGVFRLVGGKISKSSAITVTTPSSTIGIRGGISIFNVTDLRTIANFVFGTSMVVTGAGRSETMTRPGSQVIVNTGAPPGLPTLLPPGGLTADLAALETGRTTTSTADQTSQTSGFSGQNSGQNPFTPPSGLRPAGSSPQTNAVSGANNQVQDQQAINQEQASQQPAPPPPRTTQTRTGYAGGLVVSYDGEGSTTRTTAALQTRPTDVTISTNAQTGQISGSVVVRTLDGSLPVTNTVQLGTIAPNANNFFTDNSRYAMTTSDDPHRPSTVKVMGQTFITRNESALVSVPVDATSSILGQVTGTPGACACEYLTWGLWQTTITYTSGYRAGQVDVVAIAPYVAGQLANAVQLPQTGNATYSGAIGGNVQNGSNSYNAVGSYNMGWSFASRAGSFNAAFDGANYRGAAIAQPGTGGVSFSGAMVSTGAGRLGTFNGSFFSAPGDAAKYQAGTFAIGQPSSTYKAAGVFAGQR